MNNGFLQFSQYKIQDAETKYTNDTNNLLTFFAGSGLFNKCKQIPLSRSSKKFLEIITKQIVEAEKDWNPEKVSVKYTTYNKQNRSFPKGHDYNYAPKEVRDEIENHEKIGALFNFLLNNRNIEVSILAPNHKKYTKNFFLESIKKIYVWLFVASQHSSKKCSQKMNIYIYLTDLKKTLPKGSGDHVSQIHVNTAFTTSCKEVTELNLYRNEEWFKVFIHETFHNMGLDFSEFDATNSNKQILEMFPVKSDVRLFETYCETWAEILNVLFISFFSNHKSGGIENLEKIVNDAERLLENERTFSIFQCAKVLYYYGLTYEDLHEKNNDSHIVRQNQYKEKTHVLSYYILKSLLMFYSDDFIQWCVHNNNETLNFNKDSGMVEKTIDSYCNLIREHYLRADYKKSLGNFEYWFSQLDPENANKRFEIQTLRMTLYEGET